LGDGDEVSHTYYPEKALSITGKIRDLICEHGKTAPK